jgi:transposase
LPILGQCHPARHGVFPARQSQDSRTTNTLNLPSGRNRCARPPLPEEWAKDKARRQEAGVPEEVAFAPKPTLARRMVERALAAGVLPAWIVADCVYGGDGKPTARAPQHLCLDKGYDFEEVRALAEAFGFIAHIRSRGEEAEAKKKKPGQKARRWVVERTHSWMNRFRSILVRWAKKPENYLALLHFAAGLIACRAAGLFG